MDRNIKFKVNMLKLDVKADFYAYMQCCFLVFCERLRTGALRNENWKASITSFKSTNVAVILYITYIILWSIRFKYFHPVFIHGRR